jgi:hypothetical protein
MRKIAPFGRLIKSPMINADSCSGKANVLEAIVILASNELIKTLNEIGNDNEEENRKSLCEDIMNPKEWERKQLL